MGFHLPPTPGVLFIVSVICNGGCHAGPRKMSPPLLSTEHIYTLRFPKPTRLHLRLTGLRKLGKVFAGLYIKQHYPPLLFQPSPITCVKMGFTTPPQCTHICIWYCSRTGELILSIPLDPTQLLPTPHQPPSPNLFYKFVSTLCLSIYMAFVFFNTANVYHLPNRLDRFCFL